MAPALLMLIPLLGAAAVALAPAGRAKWIALVASSATFVHSVVLGLVFDHWIDGGFGLLADIGWLAEFGITLDMGADSVSLMLILLTTLLMPLCVWGSFSGVQQRLKEYYAWMLVLEAAMIGVFLARDLVFFYICFELTLVPMYFLIAIWGSTNRARACTKFFIYTFTGSLIALAGLLYVAWSYAAANPVVGPDMLEHPGWSFDIATLVGHAATLSTTEQAWVLLAMMAGFAVKVPLFPLHTWLPLAHTEAPTAGSVVLAGVLLKLGTYGLYRFVLPMTPDGLLATITVPRLGWEFVPLNLIAVLAIAGIIYAGLICWVQTDVKRLVAYSSVSHLGFCVLGLFALNPMGLEGSVLYMINHGLSTGALFFLVGMMYERYHTRDMDEIGGLSKRMPVWAFFMVFFVLASVGLPGLNGFVSEFLCLVATFAAVGTAPDYPGLLGPWYAAVATLGMVIAAMYLLIMVGKVVFGPLREPAAADHDAGGGLPADLTTREIGVLAPLAVLCVVIGVWPSLLTDRLASSAELTLSGYPQRIRMAVDDPATPPEAVASSAGADDPAIRPAERPTER